MTLIFLQVQRDWFEGCFIPANVTLSPFLECNSPDDEKGYTMTVQGFHGIPGNLHMVVNQSYYLTSKYIIEENRTYL